MTSTAEHPADVALRVDLGETFAEITRRMGEIDLREYDVILVNSSAGKDSQAMLAFLVWLADRQGVDRSRLLVVHADLGRVEWSGTRELAEEQARAYGLRFVVVQRAEDLLDQVVTRRRNLDAEAAELEAAGESAGAQRKRDTPAWPSSTARYCTSDQKTHQVAKLMTQLAAEHRAAGNPDPIRILNCLGIRAAESPARAKKEAYGRDSASNGRRTVTRWLPIFGWTNREVWAVIYASGVRYHPAYDEGMPRLSCVFCVLAGRRELVLAARLNPELAAAYVQVEKQVGHTFKKGQSIAEIAAEAGVTVE
jgi:3'-phosphoadenosine 5'-phosphosulfate sulfotransferase (PAPS reductase)/FAD synthetase